MTAVLDASAGIEVALNRSRAVDFSKVLGSAKKVMAPNLYIPEVTNALWKYLRTGEISREQAKEVLDIARGLVDEYLDTRDCSGEVLNESLRLDHPAYDLFYLIAARRTGSVLLTLDRKLAGLAAKVGLEVL